MVRKKITRVTRRTVSTSGKTKRRRTDTGIKSRIAGLEAYRDDDRLKCKLELLCIDRQLDDLKNGHKRGLVWDEDEAQRAVAFYQCLKHWKGTMAGQQFILPAWQEHGIVAPLLGWYRNKTRAEGGLRRYRIAGIEIPKKNGKSTLAAGFGLYGLIADQEQGTEIYSAATKRDQSAIVFDCAKQMLGSVITSKNIVEKYVNAITCPALNGTFKALASDHHSIDGINVHFGIIDELHRHKTRDIWDTLVASTVGRSQPITFWISTAGYDRASIWYEQHERCRRIIERPRPEDDSYFVYMTGIDEGDDWQSPEIWRKANPNLGTAIDIDQFTDIMRSAKESPQEENKTRRLHLNQITEQDVLWIQMDKWDANSGLLRSHDTIEDFKQLRDRWYNELKGEPCYGALDLASTRDLCAWALCFPRENGCYRFILRYFAPEEARTKRQEHDMRTWQSWAAHDLIDTTPGTATDYEYIRKRMNTDIENFAVRQVALDPHNMEAVYQQLLVDGWPEEKLFYFYQTTKNYNEGMHRFEELLIECKLEHGDDPVLRWMAGNLVVTTDNNGHIKPNKLKSQSKIDGMVAALMSFTLASRDSGEDFPIGTFYETHELEMA